MPATNWPAATSWPSVTSWPSGTAWPTGFTPRSLSGLSLWMNALSQAYSDTGATTQANAPTGRVRRIDQASPVGSWLAAADASRPFKEASALDFQCSSTMNVAVPVGATLTSNAATVAFALCQRDYVGDLQTPFLGNDTVSGWGLAFFNGFLYIYYGDNLWNTGLAVTAGVALAGVIRWAPSGITFDYNLGGATGRLTLAVALATRVVSGLRLGSGDSVYGKNFHGVFSHLAAYTRAVSDIETEQLRSYMVSNPAPTGFPLDNTLLIAAGDSLPRGFGLSQTAAYPYRALAGLYAANVVKMKITAISGNTIAQMQADYATTVRPLISSSRTKNILLAGASTNSLAFGAAGAYATFINDYWAYCDQARSDGALVTAETVSPRADAVTNPSFEADRLAYNILIRAGASHYNALNDKALVAGMTVPADCAGANFQADAVHYSAAGAVLVGANLQTAITPLL